MSAAGEKLYIVIPAYDERDNIYQVLDDWYPVVEKHSGGGESRLVVIDEGKIAEEGTAEQLEQKQGIYYKLMKLQTESLALKGID